MDIFLWFHLSSVSGGWMGDSPSSCKGGGDFWVSPINHGNKPGHSTCYYLCDRSHEIVWLVAVKCRNWGNVSKFASHSGKYHKKLIKGYYKQTSSKLVFGTDFVSGSFRTIIPFFIEYSHDNSFVLASTLLSYILLKN